MTDIRTSRPEDLAHIRTIYDKAFPEEDLWPLVRQLLNDTPGVVSLCGASGRELCAHVIFTRCAIDGFVGGIALLGPLAVAPDFQRQGWGRRLVEEGTRQLRESGTVQVQVLGDPAYYGRLGFEPDPNVDPPYSLPREWDGAWQRLSLHKGSTPATGTLVVPAAWRQRALWTA